MKRRFVKSMVIIMEVSESFDTRQQYVGPIHLGKAGYSLAGK